MIFRDWIIWLDITACEKILGLAPKLTTVILHNPCLAWTTHSPHRVTYLPCHLIPLYRKESVTHTVLNCSSTDAPGCRLWEVRYLSPPSYASLLLGVRLLRRTEWQGQTGGKYGHRVRMQPCPLTLLKLTMSTTAIEISPGSQTKIRKDAERGWEYVLNGSFPKQCPQYYRNHFYCHSFMSYLAEG